MCLRIASKALLPRLAQWLTAARQGFGKLPLRLLGDEKRRLFRPPISLLGAANLLLARRIAMRLGRAGAGRKADADHRTNDDESRAIVGGLETLHGGREPLSIFGVRDRDRLPAIRFEATGDVFVESEVGLP